MPRVRLSCDLLEARAVPAALFATGAGAGGGPHVKVFEAAPARERFNFLAYDPAFTGGVHVAVGDVTGDGQPDIVTAPGEGGGPHIKIFDGVTGLLVRQFLAYDPAFRGGANVAVADVTGDGRGDIITGPGVGGGPHVKVFDGATGEAVKSFLAFPRDPGMTDAAYFSGVTVAGGDSTGDGKADLGVGIGPGRDSEVREFDGATGERLFSFRPAYGSYLGGVFVAMADVDGDGRADLAASLGASPRPDPYNPAVSVNVLSGATGVERGGVFRVYDPSFTGGVRVALADVDGDGRTDIVTAPGPGGGPEVRAFRYKPAGDALPQPILDFLAYDGRFAGGVFVG